jgi:Tol biopolymer transport system component
MSLAPSCRLGPYEIIAPIGAGGMGEVWRAHDTKLNRDVAIKILLPAVANDRERLARFSREAQVLASLNQPNIAAIYGLEDSTGVPALVMELVEGPTLADRIAKGPLPLEEALPIARQIAEALEAAHEQGVIHRDLKPANIKVKSDGTVKVLDFGLAKALDPIPPEAANLANSPTLSMQATQAGIILGTAAYMSPEQARGAPVDKRTDLWAFGVVLYEMLTGTHLFEGSTVSDTLASVLMTEPDWNALPATVPSSVRRLLRRCLSKNRKLRLSDAADARLEIEDALMASTMDGGLTTGARDARAWRPERLAWVVAAVFIVVATGLAVPAFRYLGRARSIEPETRLDIVTPGSNSGDSFALSPDGRWIVFVASGDGTSRLWLRPLSSTTAQPIAGTDGADTPFWSPDSKSIAFVANSQLKRVEVSGGAPQMLATPAFQLGGTWNADGVILFSQGAGPLFRVSATGGNAVPVTKLGTGQVSQGLPVFLPDGRQFLFGAVGTPDVQGIYWGMLGEDAATKLAGPDPTPGAWYLPQGWLLRLREDALIAQRFDLKRRAMTGDPITVVQNVAHIATSGGLPAVSVSPVGLVAYRSSYTTGRQLRWFDRAGKILGTLGPQDSTLSGVSVSPDGARAVVSRTVQGNADLWLLDAVRSTRFTFDPADDVIPVWSPDGGKIVFRSVRGNANIYEKQTNGAGGETLLVSSQGVGVAPDDWSRDGRFLLYHTVDTTTGRDLWVRPMHGDRTAWVLLKTPFDERWGQFSPDGRWVAYQSNQSGRNEIYVRPFIPSAPPDAHGPGPEGQWQVSTTGGVYPRWRPDGRELFYLAPSGDLMAVAIAVRGTIPQPGNPVALFRPGIYIGGVDASQGWQYDVTRDSRFLINTFAEIGGASPITLIQHWPPAGQ